MNFDDALTYAERHTLHVVLVARNGAAPLVATGAGWELERPHPLYSGTKSFWGIAAAAAADDGLLDLDEPVAATISEWKSDRQKSTLTVRHLLTLTGGYGFGGLGNAVPSAARALAIPLTAAPGTRFTYGGVPLQVFGEVLRRKVAPHFDSAHDYLRVRVFDRIGMDVRQWRVLRDGTRPLPTGAFASAPEWLKFGRLLLEGGAGVVSPATFAQCITGTPSNSAYGMGLWLQHTAGEMTAVYAGGAGGQGLYVLPRHGLVAVHFGQSSSWNHAAFIKRLSAAAER